MERLPKSEMEIIFDSTYDGMIAVKSDGVVTLFNYTRITGLLPEAVIGRAMINMRLNEKLIETEHLPLLGCEKINQAFFTGKHSSLRTLDQAVSEAEKRAILRALSETGAAVRRQLSCLTLPSEISITR